MVTLLVWAGIFIFLSNIIFDRGYEHTHDVVSLKLRKNSPKYMSFIAKMGFVDSDKRHHVMLFTLHNNTLKPACCLSIVGFFLPGAFALDI